MAVHSEGHSKYLNTLIVGEYRAFNYYSRWYILLSLRFKLLMVSKVVDIECVRIQFFLVNLI